MTAGSLELTYSLSVKDLQRVQNFLDRRAVPSDKPEVRWILNPYTEFAGFIFLLAVMTHWVTKVSPLVSGRRWDELLSPGYMIGHVLGMAVAVAIGRYIWRLAAKILDRDNEETMGREGVYWGEQRLIATDDYLTIRLAERRSAFNWAAIMDLVETRDMLLLLLTPRQSIAVPRSAFASEAEEQRFLDFVRGHMQAT